MAANFDGEPITVRKTCIIMRLQRVWGGARSGYEHNKIYVARKSEHKTPSLTSLSFSLFAYMTNSYLPLFTLLVLFTRSGQTPAGAPGSEDVDVAVGASGDNNGTWIERLTMQTFDKPPVPIGTHPSELSSRSIATARRRTNSVPLQKSKSKYIYINRAGTRGADICYS